MSEIFMSDVCDKCHGEFRVTKYPDGTVSGICPTCGKVHIYGYPREPIPEDGATYDVFVTEDTLENGKWVRTTLHELVRTFTNKAQAEQFYKEYIDPNAEKDGIHKTWVQVLMRSKDRTVGEWYLPESIRGCRLD